MRRNFGKIDEKVRHFEINNQSQPGRTEHDNQVENVAENEEGISNGEVADDVEQVDENPGEVETADDNQFVGVVSVGYVGNSPISRTTITGSVVKTAIRMPIVSRIF